MAYYIKFNGMDLGPMTLDQVFAYPVTPDTPVSRDGSPYMPLYTYPELMQGYNNSSSHQKSVQRQDSQRILCGILALLIGTLGIQYFVIGKTTAGILTIVLSICTCGLWGIITLIQGIMILCMSDEDFENKFVNTPKTFPIF